MNETIPIQKKAALKAHKNANSKGKTLLENLLGKKLFLKEVTDRIKTVADVLEDNNITQEQIDKMFANTPEHFKCQFIAELLCKSLNEGWNPNWDNSNEHKYYPWFKMGSSGFHNNNRNKNSTSLKTIKNNNMIIKKEPKIIYTKFIIPPFRGMTIPPFGIFIRKDLKNDQKIIEHDLIHWKQYKRMGIVMFYFRYFIQLLIIGYDT
ncbi:hypothetical protein V2550_07605, partial [Tenacibaculum maritimum]|uniref:hypothetical protein n=1 Tax=Tenacibaculum maritimum TaxID=107401 RepID=UPI003876BB0E